MEIPCGVCRAGMRGGDDATRVRGAHYSGRYGAGRDIDTGFSQTTMVGGGFDHCFVIDRDRGSSQSLCAWATSEKSGISMKMYTTQPGIQLYTGNFLQDCPTLGKGGVPLQKYGGFALETQHFPCSPSHPEFPTTILRAGKVFRANTTLRFFTGRQCGRL